MSMAQPAVSLDDQIVAFDRDTGLADDETFLETT